jgi:peptide/nickel transport system permease protein
MGLYISAGGLIENKLVMIFIAVGLTMWVETARIVRGQVLSIRELEFVSAAKSLGFSDTRIIFLHVLPNILGPIIVVACSNFASAILVESGLSYIGLGIQPPAPSWGSMLNEYKDFIDTSKAYLALFPGIAIMLLVLAFNLVGNGLRDALDVRGQLD